MKTWGLGVEPDEAVATPKAVFTYVSVGSPLVSLRASTVPRSVPWRKREVAPRRWLTIGP